MYNLMSFSHCLALSAHRQLGALISRQTPLASPLEVYSVSHLIRTTMTSLNSIKPFRESATHLREKSRTLAKAGLHLSPATSCSVQGGDVVSQLRLPPRDI